MVWGFRLSYEVLPLLGYWPASGIGVFADESMEYFIPVAICRLPRSMLLQRDQSLAKLQ